MRPNDNLIRDFAKKDVINAISSFEASRGVNHQGLKGRAREIFAQQLFKTFLSSDLALGGGVILDRYGTQSNESDIILYCPEIIPPYLLGQDTGYFPVEACIYAFEIKSRLTRTELNDTVEKFKNLDSLENLFHPQFGPASSFPITTLFVFESDLRGAASGEFERFKSVIESAGLNKYGMPFVRVFCVVGKGYWYFANSQLEGKGRTGWWRIDADDEHNEVLGLVGGVVNSVRTEKSRRYGLHFGQYIIKEHPLIPQD